MLCVFLSQPLGVLPCSSRHAYSAQGFPDRGETLAGPDEYRWTKYWHICASSHGIHICVHSTYVYIHTYAARRDEILD